MTLFGIIWSAIIVFAFLYKNIKPMIYVTIVGMIWQSTNFISTSSFSCGPQLITSILFIIKSIMCNSKISLKINIKNFILSFVPLLIYILIGYLRNSENYSINSFFKVIIIYIYAVTFYCLKRSAKHIDKNYFEKIILTITLILLIIGAIQIFINVFHLPKENIIKELFFNDVSNGDTYYYLNSARFYSTFMEPSYVAGVIVGLFMYFFLREGNKDIHYVFMILLLIAMVLTYSSTAYGTFAIIMFLYCLKNIKKKKTWQYIMLAFCALVIIGSFTDILDEVIFKKGETGSARTRNRWNQRAINMFLENPLTGSGYGTLRGSSLFYTLLAELGIIGFVLYLLPIMSICGKIFRLRGNFQLEAGIFLVLSMVIAQMIACPDLDLCSFWLAMYLYAIVPKANNNSNNKENIKNEKNWNTYIS